MIIIVPDVHGRKFWKDIERIDYDEAIFLGDYLDPYTMYEGITSENAIDNFIEIIDYAKNHNVKLLLGNHDCGAIYDGFPTCRNDINNRSKIRQLFNDNKDLFSIAEQRTLNDKLYIFSHSGIIPSWIKSFEPNLNLNEVTYYLNSLYKEDPQKLVQMLRKVSYYRGGINTGSCVWGDVREFDEAFLNNDKIDNCFQIFGHTILKSPVITDDWACLDCKHVFILDGNSLPKQYNENTSNI